MERDTVISLSERRAGRVTRRFSKRLAQDFLDEIAATDPDLACLKTEAIAHYVAMESSDLVRTMRERAKLTQKQLADFLGINQSRIAFLESGKSTQGPTLGTLLRIAFICNQQVVIEDETEGRSKPENVRKSPRRTPQIEQSVIPDAVPHRAPALQQAAGNPANLARKNNQQFE